MNLHSITVDNRKALLELIASWRFQRTNNRHEVRLFRNRWNIFYVPNWSTRLTPMDRYSREYWIRAFLREHPEHLAMAEGIRS